jgi:hypothetical protein
MNYSALISALIAVESGGRDGAIGDQGRALGPLQIHKAVVQDVNRFAGTSYRWEGMTNRADARRVCDLYLGHYAKGKSLQDAARIWNGGPSGHTKSATKVYWTKVQRHLSPELAKN